MKTVKNIIKLFLFVIIFGLVITSISYDEAKQEAVCSDKGQILVRPFNSKPYCANGSREGL